MLIELQGSKINQFNPKSVISKILVKSMGYDSDSRY